MKICFPVSECAGLSAKLAATFGGAPVLLVADSENDSFEEIQMQEGACRSTPIEIDLVVCRGIGRGLFTQLSQQGIPVYGTRKLTVSEALEEYRAGEATPLVAGACACASAASGCGSGGCNPGGGCGEKT